MYHIALHFEAYISDTGILDKESATILPLEVVWQP